jgi:hypothetical protein
MDATVIVIIHTNVHVDSPPISSVFVTLFASCFMIGLGKLGRIASKVEF